MCLCMCMCICVCVFMYCCNYTFVVMRMHMHIHMRAWCVIVCVCMTMRTILPRERHIVGLFFSSIAIRTVDVSFAFYHSAGVSGARLATCSLTLCSWMQNNWGAYTWDARLFPFPSDTLAHIKVLRAGCAPAVLPDSGDLFAVGHLCARWQTESFSLGMSVCLLFPLRIRMQVKLNTRAHLTNLHERECNT